MQQTPADQEAPAAALELLCDVCSGRKQKETHSCQQCTASGGQRSEQGVNISLSPSPASEPTTREDFLQYYTPITLDPDTAHSHFDLSDGNRRLTVLGDELILPESVDRFIEYGQVLSRESLTERCYWELEWDMQWIYVAVSYRDIDKDGPESEFGYNDKSWALDCNPQNGFTFWSHKESVKVQVPDPTLSRMGVFLDHDAGVLSFYSIDETSETMRLLYRVQTTFTEPLFAGVSLNPNMARNTVYFPALKD